jgi:WD40 repeat protein
VEDSAVSVNAGSRLQGMPVRLLPKTPCGTWLLAGAVWLVGCGALWWAMPYRPRASWATEEPAVVHGFIPGTAVVLTSTPRNSTIDGPPGPILGPLVARDAATGEVREWFPDGERLTLVEIAPEGRHVVVGRVIDGRARLFLHDVSDGKVIAEPPHDGPRAENENDQPRDANEQFAAFRPDGRQVLYADRVGDQPCLRVWDVDTWQEVAAIADALPPAAWSSNGETVAYTRKANLEVWTVHSWDVTTRRTRALGERLPENHRPVLLRFSPDCQKVIAASERMNDFSEKAQVRCWDLQSGTECYRLSATTFAFPQGLPWFATYNIMDAAGASGVSRWDYRTGIRRDQILLTPACPQVWLTLAPNGKLVFGMVQQDHPVMEMIGSHLLNRVSGEFTEVLPQVWDTESGRQRFYLPTVLDRSIPNSPAQWWASDGSLLAIPGKDVFAVWDIPPRKLWSWYLPLAALLAVPPAWVARRRVRRLWAGAN